MADDEKKEEVVKKQKLWETFLANAAKGAITHEEATMVVCGDPGNTIPQLLHGMQSSANKARREAEQLPYFLNYRYVAADNEIDEALHLHTWTVQNDRHVEQIPTVVPDSHIKNGRLCYLICLDAGKPSTLEDQFKRWLAFVTKTQAAVLKNVGDGKAQELRDTLSRRLQFYTAENADPSDELLTSEEQKALEVDRENPKQNVGCQITVVVTNTAEFSKNFPDSQSSANEMFDLLLTHLRKWCLEFGAAIFTFSNRMQATNVKSYVDSVCNGPKSVLAAQVGNVSLSDLKEEVFFVPAGFDSEALIKGKSKFGHEFSALFPKKASKKTARKRQAYKQLSEKEDQKYLKILRFEITRAASSSTRQQPVAAPPKAKPPGGQAKVRDFFNQLLADNTKAGRPASKGAKRGSAGSASRRPGGGKKDYSKDAYAALKLINE